MSESAQIWAALASVQRELQSQVHTRHVSVGKYSYTYTELSALTDYLLPRLAAAGIAVTYTTDPLGAALRVACRLTASDGSSVESATVIEPDSHGAQDVGKVITYGRRYTLQMATGIATEEDDDNAQTGATHQPVRQMAATSSQGGSQKAQTSQASQAAKPTQTDEDPNAASDKQKKMIWALVSKHIDGGDKVAIKEQVDAIAMMVSGVRASQLDRRQATGVIDWLQQSTAQDILDVVPF